MKLTQIKCRTNKNRPLSNILSYKKRGNLVVMLNKFSEKNFFGSLDISSNSKPLWS